MPNRVAFALVVLAAGCDGVFGLSVVHAPAADAPPDTTCPNGAVVAGQPASLVTFCELPALQPTFPSAVMTNIDTDACALPLTIVAQGADRPEICVVAAETIAIGPGQVVTGHGQRPLVLLSTGALSVTGTIDVASRKTGALGAGANWVGCPPPRDRNGSGNGAAGAGGSFGGTGGAGGMSTNTFAGPAGVPDPAAVPSQLRGGCPGGDGNEAPTSGVHGSSGGAVYLIAASTITITGVINASGSGGRGGNGAKGGGGGGAGGMIVLDAPDIVVGTAARIFANGGGGGGGGGSSTGGGGDGADPTQADVAAPGGTAGSPGGARGGDGSAGATVDGMAGAPGPQGGGGGGGGGGYVRMISSKQVADGVISPPPA